MNRLGIPAEPDALPARPGDSIAHFEILSILGQGGMGVVYRARDSRLEREVALKCPWPRFANDEIGRARFLREARSAARLAHPNIVPVFEILEWNERPWVAMELVEGEPLSARLADRRPLPLPDLLRCARGIAAALVAAHAKQVLHRDLKPNNILIRRDGWPLLTDFGLAHLLRDESPRGDASTLTGDLTTPGELLGTRCYMSPEQILGRRLDGRSDLFSYGAVLYEMCTGRRAFESDQPGAELDGILHHQPPPISRLNPEIPRELERIVEKALAKRVDERYPDASGIQSDLLALQRRLDSADYVESRVHDRIPRSWRLALVGAAALAVIAAGIAYWRPARAGATAAAPLAGTPRQLTSGAGWEAEPALSPSGSLIAYAASDAGGADIWLVDARGGSRLRLTDEAGDDRSPAWFPDGSAVAFVSDRGGAPAIWKVPSLGGPAVLLVPDALDPAISPDGRRIAFVRRGPGGSLRVAVAPLDDPAAAAFLFADDPGPGSQMTPAWSPDGATICYSDWRDLWLVGARGERPRRLTHERAIDLEPVFTSDGRFLLFSSYREGTLALWRVAAGGGEPTRLTFGSGPESQPSVAADGSRLAYATYADNYDLVIEDLESGERDAIDSLRDETGPTLAPDGSALAYVAGLGGSGALWVQPLSKGRRSGPPRRITDLPGAIATPAFSPDGRWLAFKREAGGLREIWIVRADGGLPERFSDGSGDDLLPAWSPDGTRLAFVGQRGSGTHIWTAPVRDGRRAGPGEPLTAGETMDLFPAWSWDGRLIAYNRAGDTWVVPAGGGRASRVAAVGASARLRWNRVTGELWLAAAPDGARPRLYRIPAAGGGAVEVRSDALADAAPGGEFDITADGRLLVYTRQQTRGDVWLLEAERRAF